MTDDLTQDVLVELTLLRNKKEGEPKPPQWELLSKLVNRPAKAAGREVKRAAPLTDNVATTSDDPTLALDAPRLAALLDRLPKGQKEIIVHYSAAEREEGPPLHEVLQTTPELARKKRAYAFKLLYAAAMGGRHA